MHELHNTGKSALTFPTGNGRATILPNQTKTFQPGLLGSGFLKAIQGARSVLKLKNTSPEADKLAAEAAARIKRKGFAIVHGAGDISVEEALRREHAPRVSRPVQVRDEFTKNVAKSQTGLGPASDEDDGANVEFEADDSDVDLGDGGSAQGAGDDAGGQEPTTRAPRVKLEEVHPAVALLKSIDDETISMKELRKSAKEVLGDDYPSGTVGKEGIVEALTKATKKKA